MKNLSELETRSLLELEHLHARQNWLLHYLKTNGKDSLYKVILANYATNLKAQEIALQQLKP